MSEYPPTIWRLLVSDPADGTTNMAVDEAIVKAVAAELVPPTLRLYAWRPPSLSLGRAQSVGDVDLEALRGVRTELARERTDELERARRAFSRADELRPLGTARLLEFAELHDRAEDREAFAETFAAWCDAPDAQTTGADCVRLAECLEALGRSEEALARIERERALAPGSPGLPVGRRRNQVFQVSHVLRQALTASTSRRCWSPSRPACRWKGPCCTRCTCPPPTAAES